MRVLVAFAFCLTLAACRPSKQEPPPPPPGARNLVIITIDTLRADRVGAYGYGAARTPAMDRLAREGVRFTHAYATAPITLTSHASLMTGRYPAGHGARHNGMRIDLKTPTLADTLARAGFATGAFIAAYPLDRRFGLIKGFQTYGDRMPPGRDDRVVNERPGREVVDQALEWLGKHRSDRFFLWVHLFEPHTPYGNPSDTRGLSASARYDEEVAEADRQAARVVDAIGDARQSTLLVIAADHGEAFGEHGEIGHSIFVYDTTLRVPLILAGPGLPAGRTIADPVALIDVAPTTLRLLGVSAFDADGVDLQPVMTGTPLPPRELYAESFAALLDFGWSPLQAIRAERWKYIEAPQPELYDLTADPGETRNVSSREQPRIAELQTRVAAHSGGGLQSTDALDPDARARLQALGYAAGGAGTAPRGDRPDPKDRRSEAARLAQIASGELKGKTLERALRGVLAADARNPQANLRLGYVLLDTGRCRAATGHFRTAIAEHLPSADAHLGLAACEVAQRHFQAAASALREGERIEPGNPVVVANLGMVLSDSGQPAEAIAPLQRALTIDPDLHQARFALAIAYARAGRPADAAATADELLRRLPADAPQRGEVERLLRETRKGISRP
jgi:arylsulfatase A-like enzyme/cytochrome c-type biogenesis protein CcmH/NrfG